MSSCTITFLQSRFISATNPPSNILGRETRHEDPVTCTIQSRATGWGGVETNLSSSLLRPVPILAQNSHGITHISSCIPNLLLNAEKQMRLSSEIASGSTEPGEPMYEIGEHISGRDRKKNEYIHNHTGTYLTWPAITQ